MSVTNQEANVWLFGQGILESWVSPGAWLTSRAWAPAGHIAPRPAESHLDPCSKAEEGRSWACQSVEPKRAALLPGCKVVNGNDM